MTRRDFELIAGVLRREHESHRGYHATDRPDPVDVLDTLARHLAVELAATNDRFDADRFLTACGVTT